MSRGTLAPDESPDEPLRLEQERWRAVFENPHIGIAIVGPDLRFVETNTRFQELVGYSSDELRSMTVNEITHPDDLATHRTSADAIRSGSVPDVQLEKRYLKRGGGVVWVRVTALPVPGSVPGFAKNAIALVEDVTEKRRAELDALEKERRLRVVVDQVQAIMWTTDRDLRYTSSFGAGLKAVGLRPGEAVGRTVLDFLPGNPDTLELSSHRRALAGESSTFISEYAGRTFQAYVEPLRDDEGEIRGVIGVAVDISQDREREQLLRESEARYRLLFESNPSPMWVYDTATLRFLAVNDAAVQHYGYSREEFLSMSVEDIRPDEELPRWRKHFVRPDVYGGGEWRHRTKEGTELLAEIMARSVDFAGRAARLVLVRDVTDRRRAEERLVRSAREMRALSARLQTIREEEETRIAREVHDEIGQALTALGLDVAWLTQNLDRRGPRAKLDEKLAAMAKLIETTIGSVERIAADLRPAVLDEVGLAAAAEFAVRQFEERAGIACRFDSDLDGESFDLDRATAIFRILQEALTNVARHARARHVGVRLFAGAGSLHLEVLDDGVGINPSRISDLRSLGLLGMRERARALDGVFTVGPRREGGTRVSARIPLQPERQDSDAMRKQSNASDSHRR